ncbi:hypothetical protein PM082_012314 [Marasmius tenuissimus]|nr:hypothetical protein PM082_012314 [Marasmius tenuissimus]
MISSGTAIGVGYFLLDGATIPEDDCMHTKLNITVAWICSAIRIFYGTCIVIATGRTLTTNVQPGLIERSKAIVIGKDIPLFSKSLLPRSQYNFMFILGFNLLASIEIAIDTVPLAYRVGFLVIAVTIIHCGACSTFRNIAKSKYETEVMMFDNLPPIVFSRNPDVSPSGTGDFREAVPPNEASGTHENESGARRAVTDVCDERR